MIKIENYIKPIIAQKESETNSSLQDIDFQRQKLIEQLDKEGSDLTITLKKLKEDWSKAIPIINEAIAELDPVINILKSLKFKPYFRMHIANTEELRTYIEYTIFVNIEELDELSYEEIKTQSLKLIEKIKLETNLNNYGHFYPSSDGAVFRFRKYLSVYLESIPHKPMKPVNIVNEIIL